MTANYRQWCHEFNVPAEAADAIYKRFNDYQLAAIAEMKNGHQAGLNELKAEMGVTYPDRIKKINFLLSKYPDTEQMQLSMSNDEFPPHIVRLFSQMSDQLLGEGMQMVNQGNQQPTGMAPAEAAERAAECRAHAAFLDENHPEHKAIVRKHFEYMKMANPQASQEPPARAGFG